MTNSDSIDKVLYRNYYRTLIYREIHNRANLIKYLLSQREYDKSTEYNDNRISLMTGQQGKCYITKFPLEKGDMECHHKIPRKLGGKDDYKNLVWLKTDAHKLIHATQEETINKYVKELKLDIEAFKKLNSLRLLAGNLEITNVV